MHCSCGLPAAGWGVSMMYSGALFFEVPAGARNSSNSSSTNGVMPYSTRTWDFAIFRWVLPVARSSAVVDGRTGGNGSGRRAWRDGVSPMYRSAGTHSGSSRNGWSACVRSRLPAPHSPPESMVHGSNTPLRNAPVFSRHRHRCSRIVRGAKLQDVWGPEPEFPVPGHQISGR
jgi:hypothetical protein